MAIGGPAKFAVSVATTYHASFEEDVASYREAGVSGIGLWEYKLDSSRSDRDRAEELRAAGLTPTFCFPLTPGIFTGNGHFAEPKDPDLRLQMLCDSVRRFAAYQPAALCLLAGSAGAGTVSESRARVVAAFKRVSKVAEDAGVPLALEVISPGAAGSLVTSIPQALELIADVGASNIGVLLDTWHIAQEPLENIRRHIGKIAGIQVCDQASDSRGRFDRAMPGEGVLPVVDVIRTAYQAGFHGWYELEIFSDDGTFGTVLEHSLWKQPAAEVLAAGRRAFEKVYAEATGTTSMSAGSPRPGRE